MSESVEKAAEEAVLKVRVGIALWLLSWIPFALILRLDGWIFAVVVLAEVVVGLIGLGLAGSAFARVVRHAGWRQGFRAGWNLFRRGSATEPVSPTSADDGHPCDVTGTEEPDPLPGRVDARRGMRAPDR